MTYNFNAGKQELIDQARATAQVDQFDFLKFNTSNTKLGPSLYYNGQFVAASWERPFPMFKPYVDRFAALGEKYKHLHWLPLAVPKLKLPPYEEFLQVWEREKIEIIDTTAPSAPCMYGLHIASHSLLDFNLHDLYKNGKMTASLSSNTDGYTQGRDAVGRYTKKLFKHKIWFDLISQIHDYFPIYRLSSIMILETTADIAPHREETWAWKCPTEFRATLYNTDTEPTVYISDIETGYTEYVELPEDTDSFCWSNGTKIYGIDYHGKKNYQLIVNAIWDSARLEKLLDASIRKYKGQ